MRCIQSPCVVRFSCSLLEIDLFNPSTIFSGIIFPVNVHEHPHLSPVVTSVAYLRDFFFQLHCLYVYTPHHLWQWIDKFEFRYSDV